MIHFVGSYVSGMRQGRVEPFPEVGGESLEVCIHFVGSCQEMLDKRPQSLKKGIERGLRCTAFEENFEAGVRCASSPIVGVDYDWRGAGDGGRRML